MPLSKAIQFYSLAAQLTASEKISLVKEVTNSNPEIIINALSSHFRHAPPNDERVPFNDQYIKSMSTMIQSRESQTEEQSVITFDSLPRRLIGVFASFLEEWSFRSLSKVNRAVYLGCNMPIVLTELRKQHYIGEDHQLYAFTAFPFVKKLILRIGCDMEQEESVLSVERSGVNAMAEQIVKMSRLQSLELCVPDSEYIGMIANHEEVNRRTKYLYVEEQVTDPAARVRFFSSITSFKHLQFLKVELAAIDPIDNLDINSIIEMCSNLKGLDFHDSELGIEMAILQAIGHRLEYLTLYDLDEVATSVLKDVNFANLQQLVQGGPHGLCSDDSFRAILKTAVNLEKVDVDCTLNVNI